MSILLIAIDLVFQRFGRTLSLEVAGSEQVTIQVVFRQTHASP